MFHFKSLIHACYRSFFASVLTIALILTGLGSTTMRPALADNAIVVNTLSDIATCPTLISLRCAIATANAAASPTIITFSVSGTVTVGSTLTISNSSMNPITIDGTGQAIVIDGGNQWEVFSIGTNSVATFNNLTIQNGNNISGSGYAGGISNAGTLTLNYDSIMSNRTRGDGAGVYNTASLTINNSIFDHNDAYYEGAGGGLEGTYGSSTTINDSTFNNNIAASGAGGIGIADNAILIMHNSTISNSICGSAGCGITNVGTSTIVNSTITNNTIQSSSANSSYGGGIWNYAGTLTIASTTIASNTAANAAGVSNNSPYSVINLYNTIIAQNNATSGIAPDISGTLNSLGNNLIGNTNGASGFIASDQINVSHPGLVALADNGGATQTIALFADSPAIGMGNCAGYSNGPLTIPVVTTDQRGVTRSNPCDVGAYEGSLNVTATNTNTPTNTASASSSPTSTASTTFTATATDSATNTASDTSSPTKTASPTSTLTATITASVTSTLTSTASLTLSPTSTATVTNTVSRTSSSTATPTATLTSTATAMPTSTPIPAKIDTIGIYRTGTFYLRLHNSTGNADMTVGFAVGTKPYPIVGDWTGSGFDTVGVFDQSNRQFTLCTANVTAACANIANRRSLVLGVPNDVPLSGRWLISATNAGVGVFRPSNGLIYLKNVLTTGYADYTMVLGIPGDTGLAGDWNGKGFDSPGVYRPSNSFFYLSNQVINGSVYGDYQFAYGIGGDAPVTGDWIAQSHDGVGLFRQSNGFTYLKNQLITGYADNSFTYGIAEDVPIAGHWQSTYPPIVSAPVLILRTAAPNQSKNSVPDNSPIGD